eukprot:8321706-Alexandrium_andersonii.AAC.1
MAPNTLVAVGSLMRWRPGGAPLQVTRSVDGCSESAGLLEALSGAVGRGWLPAATAPSTHPSL